MSDEEAKARAHIASLLAVLDDISRERGHLAWDVRALMIAAAREFLTS